MTNPPQGPTSNAVIVAVCVVFVTTLAAAVAVFALSPEGENTVGLIGSLLAVLAPTLASLAVLVQVRSVSERVDKVAQDTHDLTNGLLDSKVRAGVSEVIRPDLLHPEIAPQIARDKAVRDEAHDEGTT